MSTLLECHVGVVEVDSLNTRGHQLRNIGSKLHHQLKLWKYKILDNTHSCMYLLPQAKVSTHYATFQQATSFRSRIRVMGQVTELHCSKQKYCTTDMDIL